jgi:long-chain acyl-CoA synthetase
LATIVYTSGTTGHPKGVMLSHRNILWNAEASLEAHPGAVDDRFLSFLPLSHTLERTAGCILPIMAGCSVAFARSIPQLAEDLLQIQPTVMIAVPRIFERVHARLRERLDGESPLKRRLFEQAVSIGWARFEHSQGRATLAPAPARGPAARSAGRRQDPRALRRTTAGCRLRRRPPVAGHRARLHRPRRPAGAGLRTHRDQPGHQRQPARRQHPRERRPPLPGLEYRIGELDELIVRSPGVMSGYWNQPQATAEMLDGEGWLKTGDQVRVQDGHLFITGRIKDILVLANGEKVPPADIELAITGDPLFEQVLVIGEGRPFLSALVVLNPDVYAELAKAEGLPADPMTADADGRLEPILQSRIESRLTGFPGHAKIRRVALAACPWSIENDRMTPTMKLKRAKILADYREALTRLYVGHEH